MQLEASRPSSFGLVSAAATSSPASPPAPAGAVDGSVGYIVRLQDGATIADVKPQLDALVGNNLLLRYHEIAGPILTAQLPLATEGAAVEALRGIAEIRHIERGRPLQSAG